MGVVLGLAIPPLTRSPLMPDSSNEISVLWSSIYIVSPMTLSDLQPGVSLSPSSFASFPFIFRGYSVMPKKPLTLLTPSHHLLLRRPKLEHKGKPRFKGGGTRPHRSMTALAKAVPSSSICCVHSLSMHNIYVDREKSAHSTVCSSLGDHKVGCICHQDEEILIKLNQPLRYPPSTLFSHLHSPSFLPKSHHYPDF